MIKHPSRKKARAARWPRKVTVGRVSVTVYRREMPNGSPGFMVVNYATGKRRLDSYPREAEALEAAGKLVRQLSERDVLAAAMTNGQAQDYANAVQSLAPFSVALPAAASTLAACLKLVGDLPNVHQAVKFYAARHKTVTRKPVADVVKEFLEVKENRKASARYLQDLKFRLTRFADDFRKDASGVTTAEIQEWLDGQGLSAQSYMNFRRVIQTFFKFAAARGFAHDNPTMGVERIKVKGGRMDIFTPVEIARLLAAASPDFLPCIALGAFAGLRSAEIERLEWGDVRLAERCIVVGADAAKTASRRVVPIHDNLALWLADYVDRRGRVWRGGHDEFYEAQQETAAATAVEADPPKEIAAQKALKWKANALRHSYASYRFAQIGDAGRVAGELGNSAAVVHRHYRELVAPADAQRWFNVKPDAPANVVSMTKAATNS